MWATGLSSRVVFYTSPVTPSLFDFLSYPVVLYNGTFYQWPLPDMEITGKFWNLQCMCLSQLVVFPMLLSVTHELSPHWVLSFCQSTLWDWFLQSEHLPRRVSKTHTFKISINKTDPLISWLVLIATQATWIYPILVYWSSQTCGFFCHMIENPCSICSLQIINCFSLLMDQRETWVYDHNFCGCFPFRCLRWLVLVIFCTIKLVL